MNINYFQPIGFNIPRRSLIFSLQLFHEYIQESVDCVLVLVNSITIHF
jgi:hypothetical protein